ncbi:MAG: outer membrane beta-barrel protein [Balneolaceae bacterium]|nr:outer membrane beta-barrel protein [Balneolaceae bacterium]
MKILCQGMWSEGAGQDEQRNAIVNDEPGAASTKEQSEADQSGNFPRGAFAEATETIQQKPVDPHQFFENRALIPEFVRFKNQSAEVRKQGSGFAYQPINTDSNGGSSAIQRIPIAATNSFSGTQSKNKAGSRIAVGVVLSPDLSTVDGVSNFDTPGFKGGVLAEYSLSKHFSLISGVAISNVKYKANGSEYNPPQAWNNGVMPDQTSAMCVILDIPVSLKANLFNFDRSRIFATAGLSSYIMMNEDYQFQYDGNPAGMENSWSEATGTRHWFSNAGFSIGIEYDLSPTWSIRAEPHLKIPLKGVGWGDVELYSMGSFVSLNYRFGNL